MAFSNCKTESREIFESKFLFFCSGPYLLGTRFAQMHFPVCPCPFIPDFQLCGFCQGLVITVTAVHRPEQSFRPFPQCKGSQSNRENNPQPPVQKVNVSSWAADWEYVLQHGHGESAHPSAALTTAPGLEHLQSLHSKSVPRGSMPGQLLCCISLEAVPRRAATAYA